MLKLVFLIGLAVALAILATYFGFRSKRSTGISRRNDLETRYGGGSFGIGVSSNLMAFFWGALGVAAGLAAIGALSLIGAIEDPRIPETQGQSVLAKQPAALSTGRSPTPPAVAGTVLVDTQIQPGQSAGKTKAPYIAQDAVASSPSEAVSTTASSSMKEASPSIDGQLPTTQFSGVWSGFWTCGEVLTNGGRSPRPFSVSLNLKIEAGSIHGSRDTAQTTDAFVGNVLADGKVHVTSSGEWRDQPSRNWTTRFEGQIRGDHLAATGAMSSRDGKTKFRECELAMTLDNSTSGIPTREKE